MKRSWVVRCRYPGLRTFLLGTIVTEAKAKDHEVREEAARAWAEISPHPMPEIVDLLPGMIFFRPEAD